LTLEKPTIFLETLKMIYQRKNNSPASDLS